MKAVVERSAGIDVSKKALNLCVMTGAADAEPEVELHLYGTFNAELEKLRQWLTQTGCTHVVMESTGSYWKLLANRFHLAVHQDARPFAQYVLTAEHHVLLKRPTSAGDPGCRPLTNTPPNRATACHNLTMTEFVKRLPQIAGDYFMENTFADQTGLEGPWDFELRWTARNRLASPGSDAVSIFSALEKQLGLRVAVRSVPVPVIVVDGVNETPGPSPDSVGSPRIDFEVATIKPSVPGSNDRTVRSEGSLFTLRGFTLRALIKYAWGFQDMDVIDNDDLLAPTPLLSDSTHFDITARFAAPGVGLPADLDAIQQALRALLVERFKLVTHTEDRSVSVYALVSSRPKLRNADPSNRSSCRTSLLDPASNFAGAPLFSISCHNTTMEQLANNLQPWAGAYIRHQVIDATGLQGAWDFVLRWSPPHLVENTGANSDPNGGVTLVEALDRQLGLKLNLRKHAMAVVVVDHADQRPSDN